jgi:hypothetical protein
MSMAWQETPARRTPDRRSGGAYLRRFIQDGPMTATEIDELADQAAEGLPPEVRQGGGIGGVDGQGCDTRADSGGWLRSWLVGSG